MDVSGDDGSVIVYRVSRGGVVVGEKVKVGGERVEVRVLRGREYYEARAGCEFCFSCLLFLFLFLFLSKLCGGKWERKE